MIVVRRLILFLLLLHPCAAHAGVRAIYVSQEGSSEILIANNGDASATLGENRRVIVRSGAAYLVQQRLTGPIVTRVNDLSAAARAKGAGTAPITGEPSSFVSAGIQTVNGRTGEAFRSAVQPAGEAPRIVAIISHDPALADLGRVFRQLQIAELRLGQIEYGWPADVVAEEESLIGLLDRGTALKLGETSLYQIQSADVPAELLALPAEPETRQELTARLAREAEADAAPGDDRTMISQAVFAAGQLWLLTDTGKLSSLMEGADHRVAHDLGEKVLGICGAGNELLAITGGVGNAAQVWTLRGLRGGTWQPQQQIRTQGERLFGFSCDAGRTILLTSRRLIELTGQTVRSAMLSGDLPSGGVKTALHVNGEHIFVGLDAGEWGGGLRQIDRRTGQVRNIERIESRGACGRPLDSRCDPVNAVATIPWKADCVAAAVGLIHMLVSGRILSVCGNKVDLLFAQPRDRYQPDHAKAEEAAEGGFGSVAFFGLIASGNSLVAAGDNGLYRINADGHAAHQSWPLFKRVDGILVSFALPDIILVMTEVNRRASVSGISPLLVVR